MGKPLLIIDKHPFGGLTDSYMWCKYLRDKYDVKIVTLNIGNYQSLSMEDVDVVEIKHRNRMVRAFLFVLMCIYQILVAKGPILVVYFEAALLLKRIFFWKKMILDVRTMAVSHIEEERNKYDRKLRKACEIYDYCTLISEGIREKLSVPNEKSSILPLGSDSMSDKTKDFDSLRLLYVGTLCGRDLEKTIIGTSLFKQQYPEIPISYDIVGGSYSNELDKFKMLISEYDLQDVVTLHGPIMHNKLSKFFDSCNIGVSFIPITDYFHHQPPTKTFEYIASGLYCLATATFANREVINDNNGILISDSAESFADGLKIIWVNRKDIDEVKMRNTVNSYLWKTIVNHSLKPIIEKW